MRSKVKSCKSKRIASTKNLHSNSLNRDLSSKDSSPLSALLVNTTSLKETKWTKKKELNHQKYLINQLKLYVQSQYPHPSILKTKRFVIH